MSQAALTERSRRQRAALPGGAHDRLIGLLNYALPLSIGMLTFFLVAAPLMMGGDVSFVLDKNKVAVAQERMRIQRARYQGADANGRRFELNAGSAVQKSSSEPIVRLNQLAANIQLTDGPASLTADRGRYDMNSEQVAVDGPIDFATTDGYRLATRDATIDLNARKLTSTGAVSGTTPMGTFSGRKLTADLDSRTVRLTGNARLRIVPGARNRQK